MRQYLASLRSFVVLAGLAIATPAFAQNTTQPPTRLPAATITGEAARTVTVQNDRATAVTFFIEMGRVEHALGTVAANTTGTIDLPTWAVRGARQVTLLARATGETARVAQYGLSLRNQQLLGLLVPPANGLPTNDSLLVATPAGAAGSATVTIDNAREARVTVYAEQGLQFVMLGEVLPRTQRTLTVPASLLKSRAPLRVFARPEGDAQRSTSALRLKDGDHIAVVIM